MLWSGSALQLSCYQRHDSARNICLLVRPLSCRSAALQIKMFREGKAPKDVALSVKGQDPAVLATQPSKVRAGQGASECLPGYVVAGHYHGDQLHMCRLCLTWLQLRCEAEGDRPLNLLLRWPALNPEARVRRCFRMNAARQFLCACAVRTSPC